MKSLILHASLFACLLRVVPWVPRRNDKCRKQQPRWVLSRVTNVANRMRRVNLRQMLKNMNQFCLYLTTLQSNSLADTWYQPFISSPEQSSWRAIVLPLALALASASTNVKDFRTSLFPNPLMDLVYIWYDDRYWSKILFSTIHTPMHDLKVKVTDFELLC